MNATYKTMLTIRLVEDRLQKLCLQGEAGDLHFSKGQEAISVGVCNVLRPTDHIVTHHRTIAHQIAKGAKLYPLIAEVLGKATGTNGGRAGEMHISDRTIHHDFAFQLVGTCVPVATGLAWAVKNYQRSNEIVAVFFGDAASSNGQIHEGLTIASLHKVPLLLICENNELAGNIRPEHYLPTPTVAERMRAYGIPAQSVDGNNVGFVEGATHEALHYVRRGGPYLLEMHTTRLCWHKQGQRDVRTPEELAVLAGRDPLLQLEAQLSIIPEERSIHAAEINAELDEIFARVAQDPLPELQT